MTLKDQREAAAEAFCKWWESTHPKAPDESSFGYWYRAIEALNDPVVFAEFRRCAKENNL